MQPTHPESTSDLGLELLAMNLLHEFNRENLEDQMNDEPLARQGRKRRYTEEIISLIKSIHTKELRARVEELQHNRPMNEVNAWLYDSAIQDVLSLLDQ